MDHLLWSSVSEFHESSASFVFIRYFREKKPMKFSKSFLSFPYFCNLIDLTLQNNFVYHFIIRPCDLTLFNVQWDVELQYLNPVPSIPVIQTRLSVQYCLYMGGVWSAVLGVLFIPASNENAKMEKKGLG